MEKRFANFADIIEYIWAAFELGGYCKIEISWSEREEYGDIGDPQPYLVRWLEPTEEVYERMNKAMLEFMREQEEQ